MIDKRTKRFLANNLKGLMQDTIEWMEQRNAELREGSEFEGTRAEAKLFATLRGRPRSISELARVMGISRQAVHNTVHRLVEEGVVELRASEGNRRDKTVHITARGEDVQAMAGANLRQIEKEMARRIGRENVELIRSLLVKNRDQP